MKLIQHNLFLVVLPSFEFPVNPPCAERDAKANGIDGPAVKQSEPSDRVTLLSLFFFNLTTTLVSLSRYHVLIALVKLWCVNLNTLYSVNNKMEQQNGVTCNASNISHMYRLILVNKHGREKQYIQILVFGFFRS